MTKTPPTTVRFPAGLVPDIEAAAGREGMNRNAWIVRAVQRDLGRVNTPAPRPWPAAGIEVPDQSVVMVECRQIVGRWQWRIVGSDWLEGTVAYRRDVHAAAQRELSARLGHPVEVRVV